MTGVVTAACVAARNMQYGFSLAAWVAAMRSLKECRMLGGSQVADVAATGVG